MAKKVEITIETAAETDVGELLRRSRRRKREIFHFSKLMGLYLT